MRKPFFIFLAICCLGQSYAQDSLRGVVQKRVNTGIYEVFSIDSNIIRIKFIPYGYTRRENISDAVLDRRTSRPGVQYAFRQDTVVLHWHDKQLTIFPKRFGAYRGYGTLLGENEKIFGGGERALPLNRHGYRLDLYNQPSYGYSEGAANLNYSVPFFTSSDGYGLFFDNPSKGYVDIGKRDPIVMEFEATSLSLDLYVIFGNYEQVLRSYHQITGTQPLPPRWALGHLMSRFGYTSEEQVQDILDKSKQYNIPVDAVVFDLFWFGDSIKGTMGNLDWQPGTAWPYPGKMIRKLKESGIQTILVTEPFVVEGTKNFATGQKYFAVDSGRKPYFLTDFYFGKAGLIDIFRKDSRRWFTQFYRKQMKNGVEGWWGDLGEPEKHPSDLYHSLLDKGYKRLFSADEVHNLYGNDWTKMINELYKTEYPDKRLFNLQRSGYAGTQRYSIFPWTGDVSRSWSGLRSQLPVLLGMAMSGVPYVHSDAGGFAGGEGDNELYVRWLQFAVFTPVFRPHGTALYAKDTSAFSFPSEPALVDSSYRKYVTDAVHLRYFMIPYNYSLAYQQTKYGKPLMAPLYYHFPNDVQAVSVEDEYMWGENLLVAPVLQKEAKDRRVYLPAGRWEGSGGKVYEGNKWITVPLTLNDIPVFHREGGFMPTWPRDSIRNSTTYSDNFCGLWYFPSTRKTSFEWYEDNGSSRTSIDRGNYSLIQCSGQDLGSTIQMSLEANNSRYVKDSIIISVSDIRKQPSSIAINGNKVEVKAYNHASPPGTSSKDFAIWLADSGKLNIYTTFRKGKKLDIQITK